MHIIFTYNVLSGSNGYKSGFNGKENIEEIDGWQDYGERMYNRLIGRFPTADPLIVNRKEFPWYSPYQFAGNKPIIAIDLDGLEEFIVVRRFYLGINYKTLMVRVPSSEQIYANNKIVVYNYYHGTSSLRISEENLRNKRIREQLIIEAGNVANSSVQSIEKLTKSEEKISEIKLPPYSKSSSTNTPSCKFVALNSVAVLYEDNQGKTKEEFQNSLTDKDKESLKDMAVLVNANGDIDATISIIGYASSKRTDYNSNEMNKENNIPLANARAMAAYNYLTQNLGVSPEKIIINSKMAESESPQNQKVEVKINIADF